MEPLKYTYDIVSDNIVSLMTRVNDHVILLFKVTTRILGIVLTIMQLAAAITTMFTNSPWAYTSTITCR